MFSATSTFWGRTSSFLGQEMTDEDLCLCSECCKDKESVWLQRADEYLDLDHKRYLCWMGWGRTGGWPCFCVREISEACHFFKEDSPCIIRDQSLCKVCNALDRFDHIEGVEQRRIPNLNLCYYHYGYLGRTGWYTSHEFPCVMCSIESFLCFEAKSNVPLCYHHAEQRKKWKGHKHGRCPCPYLRLWTCRFISTTNDLCNFVNGERRYSSSSRPEVNPLCDYAKHLTSVNEQWA